MKGGTNGYKRFSIELRWPFCDISKNDEITPWAYFENAVLPVPLRYNETKGGTNGYKRLGNSTLFQISNIFKNDKVTPYAIF